MTVAIRNKTTDRVIVTLKILLLLICGGLTFQAGAIIIRHDRNYGDYLIRESRFPAVFFLEQQDNRKVCVATLIDRQWAITAAHCMAETGLSTTLSDGELFTVNIANRPRAIDKMVIHPDYTPDSLTEVDLALLHLASEVEFPAPISVNERDDELHSVATILGWGYFGLGTTGRQYSDGEFRMAQNRIEASALRLHMRFDDPRDLASGVLDLEGTPGLGDSGGPALLQTDQGWTLAGVAVGEQEGDLFTEESQGNYGSIAVYERVSRHLDWIRKTIENGGAAASD